MSPRTSARLDAVAMAITGICAVHCFALPLMMIAFPLLGPVFLNHYLFHQILLTVIVPTSVIALTLGYRQHRSSLVLVLGGMGIAALAFIALNGHDWLSLDEERLATTLAGLVLASGHVVNLRATRRTRSTSS